MRRTNQSDNPRHNRCRVRRATRTPIPTTDLRGNNVLTRLRRRRHPRIRASHRRPTTILVLRLRLEVTKQEPRWRRVRPRITLQRRIHAGHTQHPPQPRQVANLLRRPTITRRDNNNSIPGLCIRHRRWLPRPRHRHTDDICTQIGTLLDAIKGRGTFPHGDRHPANLCLRSSPQRAFLSIRTTTLTDNQRRHRRPVILLRITDEIRQRGVREISTHRHIRTHKIWVTGIKEGVHDTHRDTLTTSHLLGPRHPQPVQPPLRRPRLHSSRITRSRHHTRRSSRRHSQNAQPCSQSGPKATHWLAPARSCAPSLSTLTVVA